MCSARFLPTSETDRHLTDFNENLEDSARGTGLLVIEEISGAHPIHSSYFLLPGDLLQDDGNGSYTKLFPGLCVVGFELTAEQEAKLKPTEFRVRGLSYEILNSSDPE